VDNAQGISLSCHGEESDDRHALPTCHCEERSDEAISAGLAAGYAISAKREQTLFLIEIASLRSQ
jgi:uncharacterized protein (DUF2237 family)